MKLKGNYKMNNDLLIWLQEWYSSQCSDEKEWSKDLNGGMDTELYQWSTDGIKIENIDNPGWHIEIDLRLTNLANKAFIPTGLFDTWNDPYDNDWYTCFVQDKKFCATGGPSYLFKMIEIFKEWAKE